MRVVYKNKYKAIRSLWRKVDTLKGVSRLIAGLTGVATLFALAYGGIYSVMAFVVGAGIWALFALCTANSMWKLQEHIEEIQSYQDTDVTQAELALYPLDKAGKFTLGVNVAGNTHRLVAGEDEAPITVDCMTNVAVISKGLAWLLNNGRTR